VRHLRIFVHDAANAVTDVLLHHAEAGVLGVFLHPARHFGPPVPPRQFVDGDLQHLLAHLDQPAALRTHLADHDGDGGIGAPAVEFARGVDLDQVAIADDATTRNTV